MSFVSNISTSKQQSTVQDAFESKPMDESMDGKISIIKGIISKNQKFSFLSQNVKDEIDQLQVKPQQMGGFRKTNSVQSFFGALNIQQMPENPFTQTDVEQIYGMLNAHPMSNQIGFYALFGLEFSELIQTLNTLESFLPQGIRKNITEQWERQFTQFFGNVIALKEGPIDVFFKPKGVKVNYMTYFQSELTRVFQEELQKRSAGNNTTQKKLQELLYAKKVKPFLQKWDQTQQLFSKFLLHNQARRLFEITLIQCLGIQETMQFSTDVHLQTAGRHLCQYMAFIKECAKNGFETTSPHLVAIFEELAQNVNPQSFEMPLNQNQIRIQYEKLLSLIIKHFDSLKFHQKGSKKVFNEVFCKDVGCSIAWLREFMNVIEHSIFPIADPMLQTRNAHEKRAYANILGMRGINEEKPCHPLFGLSFHHFHIQMESLFTDLVEISTHLSHFSKQNIYGSRALRPELEAILQKMKLVVEHTSNALLQCAKARRSEAEKLPLLDMTEDLARASIVVHDLDIALHRESSWPSEFPQDYLELIELEQETPAPVLSAKLEEDLAAEEQPQSLNFESAPPVPQALDAASDCTRFHLENPQPPKPPQKTKPAKANTPTSVQSRQLPPSESKHSTDAPRERLGERGVLALWQAERALRKLNLTRIEGANHAKWIDAQGQVRAVTKRHGKNMPKGTRGAIERQLFSDPLVSQAFSASALSPVASTATPKIHKLDEFKKR